MRSVLGRAALGVVSAARGVRWYVRELTGESAYDRYVEHLRDHDPDAPVPSRREFERMRTDRQETDPRQGFRCC
ncbi:YbdD/YjiX family protein [Streptomyces sp. CA-210063]|uniref:YbdD/YjiX family protein n=1 Tax=Streptomyces sp. CA-210063 TaxID=2801029 RepID=UPI00214B7231|nr:YbdD/YjiX family protein [Streptomyces sp. CA-210063]UUU31003.1 YbdD/YjiX family protein [Streptomyces sp. CA-210063]